MRRIILVLLTFLLVAGCSKSNISTDTLTFVGESQHWKAQLIQKAEESSQKDTYNNSASRKLTLQYKGNNSGVGQVKYSYKTTVGNGSGESTLDSNGYLLATGITGGKNIALLKEDEIIKVSVEWNGNKEQFELRLLNSN